MRRRTLRHLCVDASGTCVARRDEWSSATYSYASAVRACRKVSLAARELQYTRAPRHDHCLSSLPVRTGRYVAFGSTANLDDSQNLIYDYPAVGVLTLVRPPAERVSVTNTGVLPAMRVRRRRRTCVYQRRRTLRGVPVRRQQPHCGLFGLNHQRLHARPGGEGTTLISVNTSGTRGRWLCTIH